MQGSVIGQVLFDGQIQIEGRHLENDAEAGQRWQRMPTDRVAEDADVALPCIVEAGHEGDEGRLSGAIGSEENREGAGLHRQAHVGQCLARSEAVAQVLDDECGHGATTSPQGERPTPIVFTTSWLSRSMTETSLELPFAV